MTKNKFNIKKIDYILLDPKNFKKVTTFGTFFIIILLIGFVLNQYFLINNPLAYYSILGVLIFFTVISFVLFISINFIKAKRFLLFNRESHEIKLVEKYNLNQNVDFCKNIDCDSTLQSIPAENFRPSYLPNYFEYYSKSNDYLIKFKNSEDSFQFVVSIFKPTSKISQLSLDSFKKILIIKLNSFKQDAFYLCKQNANSIHPNSLLINSNEFVLNSDSNLNYLLYKHKDTNSLDLNLNKEFLQKTIYDPGTKNKNLEIYNDNNVAYLLFELPNTFMDSSLRAEESIKNFDQNMVKQAEYDLIILDLAKTMKKTIELELFTD